MVCKEKDALLTKYQLAIHVYTESVTALRNGVASIPQVEFNLLWELAQNLRDLCGKAHKTLQEHIAGHGC